jgi:hypothetical protein
VGQVLVGVAASRRRRKQGLLGVGSVMSRSHRKTPITGMTTARSEKWFKRIENRRQRAAARSGGEYTLTLYGPKDGKLWFGNRYPKYRRK